MSMAAAETLLADLDAVLHGDLAPFRPGLASADDERGLPSAALLTPAAIDAILAWYAARLGPTDRRAALSIWAGWHFQAVLPPILAANILLDRSPTLDLERVGFILSPDHKATRITIPGDVEDLTRADGHARFAGLIDRYLTPLVGLLARRADVTERVLWSNAGHIFEAFLGKIEHVAEGRRGYQQARRVLAMPARLDGTPNPLHEPVRYHDGRRIRRVCCMRFLFPDGKICSVCPMRLTGTRATVHA